MPSFVRSPKDFLTGLLLLVISGVFAVGVGELQIGSAFRMGPGYFPMLLCILLAALGVAIMLNGLWVDGEAVKHFAWRGLLNIVLAVVFFGVVLRGLGFILTLALTVFGVSTASAHFRLRTSLILTAVVVFFGWLIFIWGIGLPIELRGPWIGGY